MLDESVVAGLRFLPIPVRVVLRRRARDPTEVAMNRRFVSVGIVMVLAGGWAVRAAPQVPATDGALRKQIDQKAAKMVEALKLTDAAKAAKAKTITSDWLA